jgi:hypothetical protein
MTPTVREGLMAALTVGLPASTQGSLVDVVIEKAYAVRPGVTRPWVRPGPHLVHRFQIYISCDSKVGESTDPSKGVAVAGMTKGEINEKD